MGDNITVSGGKKPMWPRLLTAFLVVFSAGCCEALAQAAATGGLDCDSFIKNADGSWTALRRVYIPGQNVRIQDGTTFRPGETLLGEDLAARLEKACPGPATAPAASVTAPIQEPQTSASRFADANGNIDVQQLTCGNFADMPAEQAGLFLAWYSGWYNGVARRHGINLAQVQYQTRNVLEYCKRNRDQKLVVAMDRLLK